MINRKGYREAGSYRGGEVQEEKEDQPQKLKALLKMEKTKLLFL